MSERKPSYSHDEQAKVGRMLSQFISKYIILEYQYPDQNLIVPKEEIRRAGLYDIEDPADVDRNVVTELILDAIDPTLN